MRSLLIGLFVIFALPAQQTGKIEFEAASIKVANPASSSGGGAHMAKVTAGGWEARNLYLRDLVCSAWKVNVDQIVGGPNWFASAGWDIDARYPAGAGSAEFPRMLQALLADRFQLVIHRETRTMPVYALTLAKGGSKLKESTEAMGTMSAGPRMIRYGAGSMKDLASQLSSYLEREVLDQTGLTGHYVINLSFAPVDPGGSGGTDGPLPSIFQALQDQAGLKLESTKGPVEMLVIDRVEKPSPN
jgi:uncharacterized protein (TIGR03435 family)